MSDFGAIRWCNLLFSEDRSIVIEESGGIVGHSIEYITERRKKLFLYFEERRYSYRSRRNARNDSGP